MRSAAALAVVSLCASGCLAVPTPNAWNTPAAWQGGTVETAADLIGNVGWFAGFGGGATSFASYELAAESSDLDDEDVGYMFYTGYQASPFVSFAAGWVDLGSLEASGPAFGGFTDEISAEGVMVSMIGTAPIADNMALFGTIGTFAWEQDVEYMDGSGPFSGSADGASPMFGLGYHYYFDPTETIGLNIGVYHFPGVGSLEETGHENDITLFAIGLLWHSP